MQNYLHKLIKIDKFKIRSKIWLPRILNGIHVSKDIHGEESEPGTGRVKPAPSVFFEPERNSVQEPKSKQ